MGTQAWTMLLEVMAGRLNRHKQYMIEYLKAENSILREKLGNKRILLNNGQRIRLAVLGKKLGRCQLSQTCYAFSPDTILAWHRRLVAAKYDSSRQNKTGLPQISNWPAPTSQGRDSHPWQAQIPGLLCLLFHYPEGDKAAWPGIHPGPAAAYQLEHI